MDISVIIPVYNRPVLIKRAIQSVLNQATPPRETIVIDDGSDDETPQVLQSYADKIHIIRQVNRGVSAARNLGIRQASAEWIALLDSDDEWTPRHLSLARTYYNNNPGYRIFQSEEIWIRNGRRVNPRRKHHKRSGRIFIPSLALCLVSPSAVFIKKTLLDEVGLFDESFPVCEDYDLWLRIAKTNDIGLDEHPTVIKYGGHADQLSRRYYGMDYYRIQAMEKHIHSTELDRNEQKALYGELLIKLEILIKGLSRRNKPTALLRQKFRYYRQALNRMNA